MEIVNSIVGPGGKNCVLNLVTDPRLPILAIRSIRLMENLDALGLNLDLATDDQVADLITALRQGPKLRISSLKLVSELGERLLSGYANHLIQSCANLMTIHLSMDAYCGHDLLETVGEYHPNIKSMFLSWDNDYDGSDPRNLPLAASFPHLERLVCGGVRSPSDLEDHITSNLVSTLSVDKANGDYALHVLPWMPDRVSCLHLIGHGNR